MIYSIFKKKLILLIVFILSLCVATNQSLGVDDAEKDISNFSFNISINKEDSNSISIGKEDVPISIIIYSSLSCPHCANFHLETYPKIKEKYILTEKAKVTFRDFPLDLPALNAAKLLQCIEKKKKLDLLDEIYKRQDEWTAGNKIEEINKNLINILSGFKMNEDQVNKCLKDDSVEEAVLNSRIIGHKKYIINSTPTIIINEKKIEGPSSFKDIDEILQNII